MDSLANGITIYGNAEDNRCFYERMVLLDTGELLATFMRSFPITDNWDNTKSYYFYKSSDNGKTWNYASVIDPVSFGLTRNKQGMPGMYVFPHDLGAYPKGTIIFANTDFDPNSEYTIHIWRSVDNGLTWQFHSQLAKRASRNTWEPEFIVSATNRLVCYYSDERKEGYDQCIVEEISYDGGSTWEDEQIIVGTYIEGWEPGVSPTAWRPGMPRVIKLKNEKYLLIHENIEFEPYGANSFRISDDGINWGNPNVAGKLVNVNDSYSRQCPMIALIDDGTEFGRIFVRGMNDDCSPSMCYSSTDNGDTWELAEAPLTAVRNEAVGSGWSGTFVAKGNMLIEINNAYNGSYNEIRCGRAWLFEDRLLVWKTQYNIVNENSGLMLDNNNSNESNTNIIQSGDSQALSSKWIFDDPENNKFKIISRISELSLGSNYSNFVIQGSGDGTDYLWELLYNEQKLFKIKQLNGNFAVSVINDSLEENAFIVISNPEFFNSNNWNILRKFEVSRFESFNISKRYIRSIEDNSVIISEDLDLNPEQSYWKVTKGLADSEFVSIESIMMPRFYLRHFEGDVIVSEYEETDIFKQDATWKMREGLSDSSKLSFETFSFAGVYLRHRDGKLIITEINNDLDRADATFIEIKE